MPTARAARPILRKLPPDVPTRSLPTPCAKAIDGSRKSSRASPSRLEVIVDSETDSQRRAVICGGDQDRVYLKLRRVHVLSFAGRRRLAGRRVDPLDDVPVEQVLGDQVGVERIALAELALLVQAQVEPRLDRAVLGIDAAGRVAVDVLRRVRLARLDRPEDVEPESARHGEPEDLRLVLALGDP